MFKEDFGESIWRDWKHGDRVEGVLIKNGKKYTMTIFPDGSVQEKEEQNTHNSKGGGGSTYRTSVRTSADGSRQYSTHVQITSLGDLFLPFLPDEPSWFWLPVTMVVSLVLSWTPTMCCFYCLWRSCIRKAPPNLRPE
mmetsp:Transcript_82949/g.134489  ORF Transcript_82949/g.134489 Transcript_82949/m.134489 type:complete len:138 (+) Transcript_82949:588-1001(+)